MPLADKINNDLKTAMVEKNASKVSALRMLKSAVMNFSINKKGGDVTDSEVQTLLQKQIKQRRESIEQYEKAGRADLVAVEKAEIVVFEAYMPKQMSDAELEKTVRDALARHSLTSKKEFGKAMKLLQDELKGSADNRRVSDALNRILV